jgi:hypothetical protein
MAAADDARGRGCFLQFAKAPHAGAVKTRLQGALGPDAAAAVARRLSCRVAQSLRALPPGWVAELCVDDPRDPFLVGLAAREGRVLRAQGDGDLGERMWRAVDAAFARQRAVVVVGSDCVDYDPPYLAEAVAALAQGHDAVLGPALDGGYVLVGFARRPAPAVFGSIAWGTPEVLAQQRARFAALGMRWTELPPRADIDRPQDLWRLDAAEGEIRRG